MDFILEVFSIILTAMTFCILARSIMSWFPGWQNNQLAEILFQITEPLLGPLRRIIPRFGTIDISPLIAILILQLVKRIITAAL